MQKLMPRRPQPRPHEAAPTTQLEQPAEEKIPSPPPEPATIAGPLQARRVRLSVDGDQALADLSFTASPGTVTAVDRAFGSEHIRSGRRTGRRDPTERRHSRFRRPRRRRR